MLKFYEEPHLYTWNGELVPSVTQVMKYVLGDSYSNIDKLTLDIARDRGTCVHSATELFDSYKEGAVLSDYIEDTKKFFLEKYGKSIDITEIIDSYRGLALPSWSDVEKEFYFGGEFPYCGKIDRVADNQPWEIKCTSAAKMSAWNIQLSAYAQAIGSDSVGQVIHLTKDDSGAWVGKLRKAEARFADWSSILRVFYLVHHKQWLKQAKEQLHG